jgi:Zn-finger nucleic acid-binding protein
MKGCGTICGFCILPLAPVKVLFIIYFDERSLIMKCPICKEPDLVMSDRQGIEIDYCPACRGVWLDRGELDKIIEKSMGTNEARSSTGEIPRPPADPNYYDGHGYRDDYQKHGGHHGWKRRSWLGDLFD